MSSAVDAADLYFQLAREESWALEDGIVKEGSASIEQGVGVRALAGVNLQLHRGSITALLGENGAGKSTLMNILSGMLRPDAGEVRLEGHPVAISSPKHAIELGIGMVYQHTSLVPQLTVLENLMLGEAEGIRLNASAARGAMFRASQTSGRVRGCSASNR